MDIRGLLSGNYGWGDYIVSTHDTYIRKLVSVKPIELLRDRFTENKYGFDLYETSQTGGVIIAGGKRTAKREPDDSPLVPLMALQTARVGYYAHLMRTERGVDLCGMARDAVYGIAFFWALHATGLMSERSVQTGLVAVLVSWCLAVTYWSAAKSVRTLKPGLDNLDGRVGLAATAAIMLGVPVAMVNIR